jgi:hypothetical protein
MEGEIVEKNFEEVRDIVILERTESSRYNLDPKHSYTNKRVKESHDF